MDVIKTEFDEEILAESKKVRWIVKIEGEDRNFDVLVLTNKRIYGICKNDNVEPEGSGNKIKELLLSDILRRDDQIMAKKDWNLDYLCWTLEIYTGDAVHIFMFKDDARNTATLWESRIYSSQGLNIPKKTTLEVIIDRAGETVENMKTSYNTYSSKRAEEKRLKEEEKIKKIEEEKNKAKKAEDNILDSRPENRESPDVKNAKSLQVPIERPVRTENGNYSTRVQMYYGVILKCPNCGRAIEPMTVVCPDCGMYFTQKNVGLTVKELSKSILELEESKTEKNAKKVQEKEMTLLQTFCIPNTVDGIYEFILLADANINVRASRNTSLSRMIYDQTPKKELSDMWILKMRHAFQKAEIMFRESPVFPHIQKIYLRKIKDLRMDI